MSGPSSVQKSTNNTQPPQGFSSTGIFSCCPARRVNKGESVLLPRTQQQLKLRTQQVWVRVMEDLACAMVGAIAVLTFVVTPWVLPALFVPVALAVISNELNTTVERRKNDLQKQVFSKALPGKNGGPRKLDETEPLPLHNPNVHCYANSMLQLLVTMHNTDPEFRNKLQECRENFETIREEAEKFRLAIHAQEVRKAYCEVQKQIEDITPKLEKEAGELQKAIKTTEKRQAELEQIKADPNFPNEIFKLGRAEAVEHIDDIRKPIPDSLIPLRNLCTAFDFEKEVIQWKGRLKEAKTVSRRTECQKKIDEYQERLNIIFNEKGFLKQIYEFDFDSRVKEKDGSIVFKKFLLNVHADFFKEFPFYGLFKAFELDQKLTISQKSIESKSNKEAKVSLKKLRADEDKLYKEMAEIITNPLFDENLLHSDPKDLEKGCCYEQDPTILIETLEQYQLAIANWRSGSLKVPAPKALPLIKWLQKFEGVLGNRDEIRQEDVYDPLRFILDMIGYNFEYRQKTFEKDKDNGGFKPRVSSPRRNDETGMFDLDLRKDLLKGDVTNRFQRCWNHFFEHTIVQDTRDNSKDLKAVREIQQNPNAFIVRLKRYYEDENRNKKKIEDPIPLPKELELNGAKYQLRGFIKHRGDLNHGHYFWYGSETTSAGKKVWRLADDDKENPPLTDTEIKEVIEDIEVAEEGPSQSCIVCYVKAEEAQED